MKTPSLAREQLAHGGVADEPAWFVAPYLAVWPVTSLKNPHRAGWWVISGDVPTDYLSSTDVEDARGAVAAFATRWNDLAVRMARGESHPTIQVGDPERAEELAPLLRSRAELLRQFAEDDGNWDE